MKQICFVATTPFAVNAFLLGHINALTEIAIVNLCVDLGQYPLSEAIDPRVRVINLAIRRKISLWQDFVALIRLWLVFRRNGFASVHSITPKAGLLAMLAATLAGVPHRCHTFTGQVWTNYAGLRRAIFKSIDRLIAALASQVFSDSKSQCHFLEQENIVPHGAISVLGPGSICGVDLERFYPSPETRFEIRQSLGTAPDCCVFLFVGRLVRDKGVADLCRAFSALSEHYRNAELWMVGPDEEGLVAPLKEEMDQANLSVRWLGSTSTPERYMAAADLLVLPSYREGFGMVVIEAAACGIPAIASRINGIIDAVVEGETGFLIPSGNVIELANAMRVLLESSSERERLGSKAMTRTQTEFSNIKVTKAWVDFYSEKLGPDS